MASVQDQDVLRNMILTFRVTDLQMLLGMLRQGLCYLGTAILSAGGIQRNGL